MWQTYSSRQEFGIRSVPKESETHEHLNGQRNRFWQTSHSGTGMHELNTRIRFLQHPRLLQCQITRALISGGGGASESPTAWKGSCQAATAAGSISSGPCCLWSTNREFTGLEIWYVGDDNVTNNCCFVYLCFVSLSGISSIGQLTAIPLSGSSTANIIVNTSAFKKIGPHAKVWVFVRYS